MWVLNFFIPLAFMTSLAFAVNLIDEDAKPEGTGRTQVPGSTNMENTTPRTLMDRCRVIVAVTLFFATTITICLLMGCVSARASTYIIAFILVTFGITCEHVVSDD